VTHVSIFLVTDQHIVAALTVERQWQPSIRADQDFLCGQSGKFFWFKLLDSKRSAAWKAAS
jgi:hypothetical protein